MKIQGRFSQFGSIASGCALALSLLGPMGCTSESSADNVDSNSNWARCKVTSECGEGQQCVARKCTPVENEANDASAIENDAASSADPIETTDAGNAVPSASETATATGTATTSDPSGVVTTPATADGSTPPPGVSSSVGSISPPPDPVQPAPACDAEVEACPSDCLTIEGEHLIAAGSCTTELVPLWCVAPRDFDDSRGCVQALDGETYVVSESLVDVLTNTRRFVQCNEAQRLAFETAVACEGEAVECGESTCEGGSVCCNHCTSECTKPSTDPMSCPEVTDPDRDCSEPPPTPEPGPIAMLAVQTNAIDCCDLFRVIQRHTDPERDYCIFVEVRAEVGSEPEVTSVRTLHSSTDCEERFEEATVLEQTYTGELNLESLGGGAWSINGQLLFETPSAPEWLPQPLSLFIDVPVDGEWH
jgi:hypothetical protein